MTPDPDAPPEAVALLSLGADAWATVVAAARRALASIDEADRDPRLRRLAASPVSRLAAGGMRRDLARAIAAGGRLWRTMADGDDGALGAALAADGDVADATAGDPDAAGGRDDNAESPPAQARRERRDKDRARRLVAERDRARRALRGAEARAVAAEERVGALEASIAELRATVASLQDALAAAETDRAAAVERERRRAAGAVHDLEEELRRLRRRDQQRRERDRRRVGGAAGSAITDVAGAASAGVAAGVASPRRSDPEPRGGRPTRLPDGVVPGTREAAEALLHPPRHVVVDGYNVSRTHRPDLDLEQQREWLVGVLRGLAARRRLTPLVVFDGAGNAPTERTARGVRVRFSPAGHTADDEIHLDVAATEPDLPVTVVTDDRELRDRVRAHHVDLLGTREFLWAAS